DRGGRGERQSSRLLQRVARRGQGIVAIYAQAGLAKVLRHRRAHDAQADDADGLHFFFFAFLAARFFAGAFFLAPPTGFAFTSTTAMMQGSAPRTLHE